MSRKLIIGAALVSAGAFAAGAYAKQYVDYTPDKGVWEVTAMEVDPNHVDDYLVGLRQSQLSVFKVLKQHGVIDDYHFIVRQGYVQGGPNVLIEVHYPSAAMLDPNKARDQMIEKETNASFSEDQQKTAVAGYEKYRKFIDDGYWSEMKMAP